MKNSEMQNQKILNFLYGNMNDLDKRKLEEEINSDSELKKELQLQKDIDKAIQNEIRVESFMSNLNKIHEEQTRTKIKVRNLHNKWYYAAASITLVSGTAFYSLKHHFQSNENLYNTYYQTWQPGIITRGAENETLSIQTVSDFENGHFEKVIAALNENFKDRSIDPKLLLLKGCAEMEISNYAAAINTFSLFESKNYTFYTEAGQWYLALCYLKNDNIDSSKNILNKIVESNTSYAVEASELLKELN